MLDNDPIFNKIAQELLVDYTSVYYVNAVTNEYQWYSADPEFHSLHLEKGGDDFFKNLVRDADKVIYEPDKHIFMQDMQKEKLLAEMKKGTMQSIEYRLMIDGRPVYHSLRLIRGLSDNDDYFILGVINIDKQVREKLEAEKLGHERNIFNQIAASLAEHYDTLYYIDAKTSYYFEFSSSFIYKSLGIPSEGNDFFTESRKNIRSIVHPDDRDRVLKLFYKESMLQNLRSKRTVNVTYRLIIDGEVAYYRLTQMWANDKEHLIVCIENVDAEIRVEKQLKETQKKTITYEQIAQSLASKYDVIYYVDSSNGLYAEFTSNNIYGKLEIQEEGNDFFADVVKNGEKLLHPDDKERVFGVLQKDYLITVLEDKKQYMTDYRLVVDNKTQYTRLTVTWSSDRVHFIIGIENINDEVKKEKEQVKALSLANAMARRDELTGVKNKKAYQELEDSVQSNIDSGADEKFAVVVCDINNLKIVNDTQGHKAGDEYIRASCQLICNVFTHSRVFRIGGDEFVAFLGSGDYADRAALMDKLNRIVVENLKNGEGPVVAAGIADFDRKTDEKMSDVFDRADKAMYAKKSYLKELGLQGGDAPATHGISAVITTERKAKLEGMFAAFDLFSGDGYVYLCDMKYDYSIWDKRAVEKYGMPDERMYRAGDIWEERVHPDDRDIYRAGINAIFTGNASGHDMHYRAMTKDGNYQTCICKGIVLRDDDGSPDYFGGKIIETADE